MEAIGQLTGGIAHDFNNVLQAITGYCEVLKLRLPEENQKYVAEITKAAHRAATLTAQLLAFSRKQILRPQIVNTKDLIRSMQKMLERVIGEDIELRTFIDPDTGNFLADPGQTGAGPAEPRGQRAGCHALGWEAYDRDCESNLR